MPEKTLTLAGGPMDGQTVICKIPIIPYTLLIPQVNEHGWTNHAYDPSSGTYLGERA